MTTLTRTVLLVEDSDEVRKVMVKALEREGFAVVDVGSGPEALRVLDVGRLSIDLIVTDVNLLGEMDGVELAVKAKTRKPGLPVLFISGAIAKAPAANFLPKPFSLPDLVSKVRELLAEVGN